LRWAAGLRKAKPRVGSGVLETQLQTARDANKKQVQVAEDETNRVISEMRSLGNYPKLGRKNYLAVKSSQDFHRGH